MLRALAIGTGFALVLAAGTVNAGTPLGGDDTGFIPPTAATAKCEEGVAKASAKLTSSFFGCHIKMAAASFKASAPQDDESCETTARSKYDATVAKLTNCPPCLNPTTIADNATSQLEMLANAALFCDGTTPFGGDDGGNIPSSAASLKCEAAAAKLASKLAGALIKCHIKMASASLKAMSPQDDDTCETAAKAKFSAGAAKLTNPPCPTCLVALLPTVGSQAEGPVDSMNSSTYCASPSGSFLN